MINTEYLVSHIPYGKDKTVSRHFLCLLLGTSDREMRRSIQQARIDGHIIINSQDGRGYYQSDEPSDILKQYKQNEHRAKSILVQQKHLRARLKDAGVEV